MIRVAIWAASPVERAGLAALLARSGQIVVLDQSADRAAPGGDPDVVLAVLEVGGAGGDDARGPDREVPTPAVILMENPDSAAVARLLRGGARAVVSREASAEQIEAAVAAAAAGLVAVPAAAAATLATLAPSARSVAASPPLSPREAEVLNLIAMGLGNKLIARRLGISGHTVKSHIEAVFEKLGVGSRAEAVARGIQLGIVLI